MIKYKKRGLGLCCISWVTTWVTIDGKSVKHKLFSVLEHGHKKAFELACKEKNERIKILRKHYPGLF